MSLFLRNTHPTGARTPARGAAPRAALAVAAIVALALAAAGCGEKDEEAQTTAPAVTGTDYGSATATTPAVTTPEDEPAPNPRTDEEAITATLRTVLSSADARATCEELVTENFVREAYGDVAYIVERAWEGPGGLPLGTQGRCISMLSGGYDSPVATWMLMRRGSPMDFVHLRLDCAETSHALLVAHELWRCWGQGTEPRVWLVENPGFVSGGSISWFLDTVGGGSAATLDGEAAATAPGADGITFLPTLSGSTAPRWNDAARGVVAGLSLNHGRGHLFRSVLEGCTFALRDIVDRLDAMGLAGSEIRVVGGGARSPFWLQMKADVTGRTVRVLQTDESTALGAAMLAAVGAGFVHDLDEAVERYVVVDDQHYEPDPTVRAAYDDAYGRYRRLFDAVEPTFG